MSASKPKLLSLFTVDAFTSKQFQGNPAAVCPLEEDVSDDLKQNVAKEMNLSETAFITKVTPSGSFQKDNKFNLKWFTPTTEVTLCGHGTLAAAATIFRCYGNVQNEISFETKSGTLTAKKEGSWVILDMPQNPPFSLKKEQQEVLAPLIQAVVGDLQVEDVKFSPVAKILLIRLNDSYTKEDLEKIRPNFYALLEGGKWGLEDLLGILVTLKGGCGQEGDCDFTSRFFAPWAGVNEDPVCGSAHTVLAPYWSQILGKTEVFACQLSPRKGELRLRVRKDGRVDMAGEAVILLRGNLNLQ